MTDIIFYEDHRGTKPVQEFLNELTSRTELNQITAYMRELRAQGFRLQRPWADFLRDDIYELRPGHNRILYGFCESKIILLHALRKKTREVPDRDIDLALKRLQAWRQR